MPALSTRWDSRTLQISNPGLNPQRRLILIINSRGVLRNHAKLVRYSEQIPAHPGELHAPALKAKTYTGTKHSVSSRLAVDYLSDDLTRLQFIQTQIEYQPLTFLVLLRTTKPKTGDAEIEAFA